MVVILFDPSMLLLYSLIARFFKFDERMIDDSSNIRYGIGCWNCLIHSY